jgi:ATP-binding cassette subfamily B protein AbcA/BmrA
MTHHDYKKAVGASHRIYEIMQEPIEPTESLEDSKDVEVFNIDLTSYLKFT